MREALHISTDQAELGIDPVHGFLSRETAWARGIPRPVLETALANSLCLPRVRPGTLMERYDPTVYSVSGG